MFWNFQQHAVLSSTQLTALPTGHG